MRPYKMRQIKTSGFTLLEVLVASVILFSALSLVSLVYRNAILASTKATNTINIATSVKPILKIVEDAVKLHSKSSNETISGNGNQGGVEFVWHATLERFEAAPEKFDVDKGNFVQPDKKFKLWLVTLRLKNIQLEESYQFYQLGWNDV